MLFSAISTPAITLLNTILCIAVVVLFVAGFIIGRKLKNEPPMTTIFKIDIHWNIWLYVAGLICLVIFIIW